MTRLSRRLVLLFAVTLFAASFALPSPAATACTTVTSTDDSSSAATTPGTLRYAIAQANGQIGSACDSISFNLTYPATITLGQGQLEVTNTSTPITISGPGATNLFISGNNASRVFLVDSGVTAKISGVTIENGTTIAGDEGGGIYNTGTLTVTNSTLSGNVAGFQGGGINSFNGTLTVTDSTISGNVGVAGSGGIGNFGTLTVTDSTLSGNYGGDFGGGGIGNFGTLTMTNSTLSGNSAQTQGGGILNLGNATLTVTNSTLSGNSATDEGGGIYTNSYGTATLKNTILASNLSGNCSAAGSYVSDGYNLSDDTSCTSFTATGDVNNTAAGLGPLANNGGPTQTIALLAGSPAIDAIPVTPTNYCTDVAGNAVTTDQRGISRPQGPKCDIGAYELVQTVAFDSLSVNLEITTGATPGFDLSADLTLGTSTNGINPLTEPVTLTVGSYSVTIPAGSFKLLKKGRYAYQGKINGVSLQVQIVPLGGSNYKLKAQASPVTPATSNPVTVTITIGDDSGTESVTAQFN